MSTQSSDIQNQGANDTIYLAMSIISTNYKKIFNQLITIYPRGLGRKRAWPMVKFVCSLTKTSNAIHDLALQGANTCNSMAAAIVESF